MCTSMCGNVVTTRLHQLLHCHIETVEEFDMFCGRVIVPGQGSDPTGYRLYRILPGADLLGTTTVHNRLLYRRSHLQLPRRS